MDNLRRRRHQSEASDQLHEPLLGNESTSSGKQEAEYGAVVSRDINKFDWEELVRVLASACRSGWNTIVATLRSCIRPLWKQQDEVLSLVQEERLQDLRQRIEVPYDGTCKEHQEALKELWAAAFPTTPFTTLKSAQWREMGWQGDDPGTDFRGAGLISLQNHLYMARHEAELFQRLLHKHEGERSQWEYPFAVAGVNITFALIDLLDLRDTTRQPRSVPGRQFLHFLEGEDSCFEELYCAAFERLDREWLEMRATYMDFPAVLKRVMAAMDQGLSRSPASVEDVKRQVL